DRGLRNDAVENQRQRRREQQPETARRGDEAEAEALGVAGLLERGEQQRAERNDGDARSARERGEQRTGGERDHGEPARQPAEQRLGQPHEPRRRSSFAQQETGEREQRYR